MPDNLAARLIHAVKAAVEQPHDGNCRAALMSYFDFLAPHHHSKFVGPTGLVLAHLIGALEAPDSLQRQEHLSAALESAPHIRLKSKKVREAARGRVGTRDERRRAALIAPALP